MEETNHQPPERRRGEGFNPGAALAGIIFVVLGALFLLDAMDVANIRRDIVWPSVVIALGIALVVSSFWRARA